MMGCVEEKINMSGLSNEALRITLMEEMKLLKEMQDQSGNRKAVIHSELWHACAGPLVSLPHIGSLVYYFPQGHSEQVAVSTQRSATTQVPNYPNLPSQLMCQVHNVTLHADRDTDEIYAQMSLQPVLSEKDVFPISDFGLTTSKHPTEFFCKTLTASDTSTHGGFSVPRRAAEKLFPPLDYNAQPPTQELVVRDLHENTWTFRHVYRGQPKRHLLTTGWSLFVGSKRLRAGDSVLFIRDEKSQLMVGVRRSDRQQNSLQSSVLSTDSMHIGVLAAAAHAAAKRTPFTIFYNPRACPSEFVISLAKYRKAVCGNQLSAGMRFGMMFETEDSNKRRYMGTMASISDFDPLGWPGSKWRNLQVEWDEPGCTDKPTRVSSWEIETPESLFIFPPLSSGLKRPMHSSLFETDWGSLIKRPFISVSDTMANGFLPYPPAPNFGSEHFFKMMMMPQNHLNCVLPSTMIQQRIQEQPQLVLKNLATSDATEQNVFLNQTPPGNQEQQATHSTCSYEKLKQEPENSIEQIGQMVSIAECKEERPDQKLETSQQMFIPPQSESAAVTGLSQFTEPEDVPGVYGKSPLIFGSQDSSAIFSDLHNDVWDDHQLSNNSLVFDQLKPLLQQDTYSVPSMVLDEFCNFQNHPSDCLAGNFSSVQDVQSQITSTSFPDNSGGTSSSYVDFDESSLIQNNSSSWRQVAAAQPPPPPPRVRTYTKVQKAGSVGRSIDVTSLKNYGELKSAIERMFGLEGLLVDPKNSGWKLVYVDYENDVLLVGDDPWAEFVGCVRCIRILSPAEVQQMTEEGMAILNSAGMLPAQL